MPGDDAKKKLIMICDDDRDLLVLTGETLKDAGFDILLVNEGSEVKEKLKKWAIDLIILDVKMAEMHGVDVLKQIREVNPSIPVIIFTSYPQMAGLPDFKIFKAYAIIEKGSWGRLESAIRSALKGKEDT